MARTHPTDDECAAFEEFVSAWERGKSYAELLRRLHGGRIEVPVLSKGNRRGIIFIENGAVYFKPLDEPEQGTVH